MISSIWHKLIKSIVFIILHYLKEWFTLLDLILSNQVDEGLWSKPEASAFFDLLCEAFKVEFCLAAFLEGLANVFINVISNNTVSVSVIFYGLVPFFISCCELLVPAASCQCLILKIRENPIFNSERANPIPLSEHINSPVSNVILPEFSELLLPLVKEFGLISRGPLLISRDFICHTAGEGRRVFKPFELFKKEEAKNVPSKCGC